MDYPQIPDFPLLISHVSKALQAHRIPFMLIGGQAVLLHGRPRITEDIDITLGIPHDQYEIIVTVCAELELKVLPSNIGDFVQETNVLPTTDPQSGIRVDFIFSDLPYERQAIERAISVKLNDTNVSFSSAEDLILHKLFSGRPRDIEDVESVIRRQGDNLDWDYLQKWALEFSAIPGKESLPDQISNLRSET